MSCWTKEEIDSAEGYYNASDHELQSEVWEYISEMLFCVGYTRTPTACRSKLHIVWRNRKEQHKFCK